MRKRVRVCVCVRVCVRVWSVRGTESVVWETEREKGAEGGERERRRERACVCEGERVPAFALACLVQCSQTFLHLRPFPPLPIHPSPLSAPSELPRLLLPAVFLKTARRTPWMRQLQLVGSVYRPDGHAAPDKSSERHDHRRAAPVSRLSQQKHRVRGND